MTPAYVIAVDLGTGGPKVALVSTDGTVVDHEQARTRLILLEGGGAEQDPDEWWEGIAGGIRRIVGRGHVPVEQIVAVSVTSQWMGTVAVDAAGHHLGNALIWLDSRGAPHSRRVAGGGVEVPGTGYNARRLQTWLRYTGGVPSRTGKDPVGHILWLRHERPEVYAATAVLLEPMDYVNLRLTGRAVASYGSVTGYWCTDNRDLAHVAYVDRLVRMAGLDRSRLPDLVPTGSVIGTVAAGVAAELGIGGDVAVVTATGDTASAGIGAGAVRDFDAHLYVGTSSWLSCHVPFKKTDVLSSITSLPSGIPGRYWVATEQDVAGKALTWLVENVLYPGDDLDGGRAPADVLRRLDAMAADVPPGSGGVLFTPWLNGERTPVEDATVRGGWLNVSLTTDRRALVRSVYEGVALNTRWMLEAAERFVRRRRPRGFESIRFVGGGATSPFWCQVMADVLDRPVLRMEEPALANLRGAALCASVALGHLRWEDVPGRVRVAAVHEPQARNRRTYDDAYVAFTRAYRRTRKLYATLNRRHEGTRA